jgi:ABC-type transporter Mla subunit MlaD
MIRDVAEYGQPRVRAGLVVAGVITMTASVIGLVLGIVLVGSLVDDLTATVALSRSAIEGIAEAVEVLDQAAGQIDESLDAAAGSVEGASATASAAAQGLEGVADLLEEDLPAQIDAILLAMPAAIQAAGTIDGTLRALSLFGLDYSPDEPFDESLRGMEAALSELPPQLREQSETVRRLIPSANQLVDETGRLASALRGLQSDLGSVQELTGPYQDTVAEASATIAKTEASLAGKAWLMRSLVIAAGLAGLAVGWALILVSRAFAPAVIEV